MVFDKVIYYVFCYCSLIINLLLFFDNFVLLILLDKKEI